MLELEKSYLAKSVPEDLDKCKKKEVIDLYIPEESHHPILRIRKRGSKYTITKKFPINEDASTNSESTIVLDESEYDSLVKLDGKKVSKIRYYYPYKNTTAEFDVFTGELKGLVIVEFEFETEEERDSFEMPEFCLVDVTSEAGIAGGFLAGKSYNEIKNTLDKYNYSKLFT